MALRRVALHTTRDRISSTSALVTRSHTFPLPLIAQIRGACLHSLLWCDSSWMRYMHEVLSVVRNHNQNFTLFDIVALVASPFLFISFFNQSFSEEFFAMLKVSPLGATVISGYFVLFFVTWGTSFFQKKVDKDTSLTCRIQSRSYFPTSSPYAAFLDGFSSGFDTVEAIYHTCVLIACDASSGVTVSLQFSLLHHLAAPLQCVCIQISLSYIIIYIIHSCLRRHYNRGH